MIRAADGPIPRYGDATFNRLDPTSPRRIAAILVAAECWAEDSDRIAERLRREIAAGREAEDELDAEAGRRAAEHVHRIARVPTFEELSVRRSDPRRAARARERADVIRRDADALRAGWPA